jgi:hypothetical protein
MPTPSQRLGITGRGVHIGLLSAGTVRQSHIAFERKEGPAVQLYDFTGGGFLRSWHDTHIAGIIVSAARPAILITSALPQVPLCTVPVFPTSKLLLPTLPMPWMS